MKIGGHGLKCPNLKVDLERGVDLVFKIHNQNLTFGDLLLFVVIYYQMNCIPPCRLDVVVSNRFSRASVASSAMTQFVVFR